MNEETARRFATWITTAADSVDQLRRCDVLRVVEYAHDGGMLTPFVAWLAGERPDLAVTIHDAAVEVSP
jgi:hypothetical protein